VFDSSNTLLDRANLRDRLIAQRLQEEKALAMTDIVLQAIKSAGKANL
jgi:hypothetical protein